jgi:uncharacterized protein (TIGR03118 family)
MSHTSRRRLLVTLAVGATALSAGAALAVPAAASSARHPAGNEFLQTNLVSDLSNQNAKVVDPDLQNPWGLAFGPTTPLWVSDNNNGLATVYAIAAGGTGATKANLTVALPGGRVSTGDGGSPTGQVFNGGTGFVVTSAAGSGPARFIFSAESGQISAWSPVADPVSGGKSTAQVVYSSPTAVYKGLTIATDRAGTTLLYATNFHDRSVDVFDTSFNLVQVKGGFADPSIPWNYAPFGIQAIGDKIYVTYAEQDAAKHDDVPGPGHGFVDVFNDRGFLVDRVASRGALDSPWGLAMAPDGFGGLGDTLLVGNLGNGWINSFEPFSGKFRGPLLDGQGRPIAIDGLWGLAFGTASTGGTGTLLFSAGINNQQDGLIGALNPAS